MLVVSAFIFLLMGNHATKITKQNCMAPCIGGVGSVDTVTASLLYVCGLWLCAIGMKNPQRVMPRHGMPFGENGIVSY